MLTCVLSLTACGSDETISDFQQSKIDAVESMAPNVVTLTSALVTSNDVDELTSNYNNVELGDLYANTYTSYTSSSSFQCDGKGIKNALVSFQSGLEEIGSITISGECTSTVDDDTIVVTLPVTGENGATASVELIYSNDIYMELQSCTLNIDRTLGELMQKAVLNTLIGMGTVFIILILISAIIYLFAYIPKIQDKLAGKETAPAPKPAPAPAAAPSPAPAAAPAVAAAAPELAGDEELAAVIAAAIAAYEGTSTDGFRVRSIKRAANSTWRRA